MNERPRYSHCSRAPNPRVQLESQLFARSPCPSRMGLPPKRLPSSTCCSTQEGEESAPLSIVENGPQQAPRAMLEPDWTTCRKIRWAAAGLQERNAYFLMASIEIHVSPMPHLECTARTTTCTVRGVAHRLGPSHWPSSGQSLTLGGNEGTALCARSRNLP